MIRRPIVVWIATAISALALSGCYTVLQAPGFVTRPSEPESQAYTWDGEGATASPTVGDFDNSSQYPYGYGPTRSAGVPVFGYDTLYGLYGYGSPYAYGRYGGLYSGGYGHGYSAGPYGYGYDPYYYGSRGSYVPPGYELITTDALQALRNQQQGIGTVSDPISDAERATQVRRQQRDAERAWTQRTQPERRSTTAVRTPRPAPSSGRVTSSSSSSSSSSSESSGSSAAKRRKKKR